MSHRGKFILHVAAGGRCGLGQNARGRAASDGVVAATAYLAGADSLFCVKGV